MSNIEPQRLARFASAVYEKTGVPREDAAVIADTLVQADFWAPVPWCAADRLVPGATAERGHEGAPRRHQAQALLDDVERSIDSFETVHARPA